MNRVSILLISCLFIKLVNAQQLVYNCGDNANKRGPEVSIETGISSTSIEIKYKGNEVYSTTLYYTDMVDTICIPAEFKSNACITEAICKNFKQGTPENSLAWLNQVKINKRYDSLSLNLDFSSRFALAPVADFKLPISGYYYHLNDSCVVTYASHNIGDTLKKAGSKNDTILYTLKNAVVMKQHNQYYWLFISDGNITDGYSKLRFNTIISAKFVGEKVVIERMNTFDEISVFVINYHTGALKCYHNLPDRDYLTGYSVVNNNTIRLILHGGGERLVNF